MSLPNCLRQTRNARVGNLQKQALGHKPLILTLSRFLVSVLHQGVSTAQWTFGFSVLGAVRATPT